jgi:hypothetical protein
MTTPTTPRPLANRPRIRAGSPPWSCRSSCAGPQLVLDDLTLLPDWTGPDLYDRTHQALPAAMRSALRLTGHHADDLAGRAALAEVPEVADAQAQGDLIVLPWPPGDAAARSDLLAGARPTVSLRLLGSHLLIAAHAPLGWSWWITRDRVGGAVRRAVDGPTLGTLTVPIDGIAYLVHAEHAPLCIAPGVYALRRQRRWLPTARATDPVPD